MRQITHKSIIKIENSKKRNYIVDQLRSKEILNHKSFRAAPGLVRVRPKRFLLADSIEIDKIK
ncbi:hypothetical protein [Leptospira mayottensis]|uniref:Uncharacterized protein n=2 Tax=Leptospira mayottensis TaxID=1137606 RepID=A0AA87MRN9_9LEPT|nr:hypothetical protein [Leptospira mayottensis]AXR63990.1 hypothetical protein DQM28_06905 [Leptospira mayottensis]EKS00572.1 hypothetical protein LEP1GSC125_2697 [Leptospira mayottensis 200901122]